MIEIAGRKIGPGHPCFIIAEAGVNHNGSLELAKKLVDVAAAANADAVKFQTFRTELVTTRFPIEAAPGGGANVVQESQFDMLKRLELSTENFFELRNYCLKRDIMFLSTPFEEQSADLLEKLGVPAYKIPSGEITNLPFIEYVAHKGLPIIVSTGMSTLAEVEAAVGAIEGAGNQDFVLLHCVSAYPASPADINLRAMQTLATAFGVPVGFSDHTLGTEVALAAVALGACVIEKHFTLDRTLPGPDHCASLEPKELSFLVEGVRIVEAALGHGRKGPSPSESNTAKVARKSIVASRYIPAGMVVTRELVAMKNPGSGLPPSILAQIIGRTTVQDIPQDTLITWDMLR